MINAASFLHDTSQGGYVFDITACPSNFSYGRIATEPLQVFGSEATSLPYKTSYVAPSGLVLHRGTAELFLDDLSVAKTGDPVPGVPGATWSTLLGHGITDAEEELVGAFYTKSDGTSVAAAFVGLDKPPPYSSDMPLGPTGEVGYATSTPYFSPNGQHVVYTADLLSTNGLRFKHVILDGAAYCLGGSPVVEGEPVPASIGGLPGELWQNFAFFDVTDDGRVLFAGDSNASGSRDDFLVKDGSIFLREGDTIDGFTLAEDVSQPQWTLDGRVAFVWSVNGSHGTEDIVGLEDHIYLFESDPVDWDADGFADDEFTVTSLGFTAVLTVDSKLVFQVSAQLPSGSFSSAVFELPVGFLIPRTWLVSAASGGSIDFDLDAGAGASGQFYALAGSMSGTSPGLPLAGAN
ncbi:MAG TPA: hypothetical protein ENJ50_06920, partial [Planctomycetaceae bacterium]|nr:hypothetical protein [Planctomycetaceae bacterium]